ncbi:MAG: extracellular solute-binding protein [Clostridia bacterium]|nr:extracellular solute-binding protein [Clostridia bacterium]
MNKKLHWLCRLMALAIMLTLVLGAMAGCNGGGGENSGSGENGEVEGFDGATLKVSIWTDTTIPKLGNSELGDAKYYALEQAKKKYNCNVEWVILPESQYFDEFVQAALSGTTYSNIALQHSSSILSWIKQDLVAPTDSYIGENKDNRWNTSYAVYKGVNYGLFPTTANPTPYMMLLYNTRMVQELGLEDPQKLALEGKWDWNTFRDYCKRATDPAKGTYGVSAFMLPDSLRYANSAYLWVEDGGKYYNAYNHPSTNKNALELLTLIRDMAINDGSILGDRTGGTTAKDDALNAFTDGNLLFMFAQQQSTLKKIGFTEYAPVTFPIGPSCGTYYNMRDGFAIWGIPTTNDYEADLLAKFWMDALTTWDPSRGDAYYEEDLDELIDALHASSYNSRKDAEFVYTMGAKMPEKASLNNMLNLGATEVNEIYYPILSGKSTPAAVIEATNAAIQARIDEVFNTEDAK